MIYEARPRPLSEALAAMPDLRNRLLADHVPDASGHRCRACTTPGTGTPGAHWPSRIREAAALAHHSSRLPPKTSPFRAGFEIDGQVRHEAARRGTRHRIHGNAPAALT